MNWRDGLMHLMRVSPTAFNLTVSVSGLWCIHGCLMFVNAMCLCIYRGFLTRMVYLFYISCLRYTILVRNPQYVCCVCGIWQCVFLSVDCLSLCVLQKMFFHNLSRNSVFSLSYLFFALFSVNIWYLKGNHNLLCGVSEWRRQGDPGSCHCKVSVDTQWQVSFVAER